MQLDILLFLFKPVSLVRDNQLGSLFMNELSNTLEDLLTAEQLKEYLSKEYPFNTNFLGAILKEKLKQDPDYEVWVPFFYCKYTLRRKDPNSPSVIHSPFTFVSNKGGLVRLKKGKYIPIPVQNTGDGYLGSAVRSGVNRRLAFSLHRVLGTVFIPLPPELELWHPKDLQVNHIDGMKSNFELENLEWSTDSGNKTHAVDNGLIKSGKNSSSTKAVKGKVEFGPYLGYEFILHGKADFKEHGFTQQNINACCQGLVRSHKNCSWAYATDDEISVLPHGLSEEIRESLNGMRRCILQ